MPLSVRLGLTLLAALAAAPRARADDRPEPYTPARPETREELNHREALRLYALGALHEHNNRLLAAVRAYEEASRLDPEAAPPYKALVPLYLGLDRLDDALTACKEALDLDPGDHETWHLYARQLRVHDRPKEAAAALDRALACPGLKEHPEQRMQVAFDLAVIREDLSEFDRAESAFLETAHVLDNPDALMENGDFDRDAIDAQAADIYERLGRVSLRAGRSDRAKGYFVKARDKVKEKDPARAKRLAYNLAELYLAREEWQPALGALDEYLETLPQGTEAYRAKIKALQKLGRGGEVLGALENYANRDGQNAALRLLYAEQLGAAGRFPAAEAIYQDMAKATATPEVYRGLFKLYADNRPPRFDRLLALLDDTLVKAAGNDGEEGDGDAAARGRAMLVVLREDPRLVLGLMPVVRERLTGAGGLNAATCYFLGVLAARTRQLDDAEKMFRQCLADAPGRGRRLVQKEAEVYDYLLRVLRLAHKNKEIVALCHDGLGRARATSGVLFHVEAAQALARLGQYADALKEADAAIADAPDTNRLYCQRTRVQILSQAGRYDRAEAEALELLKDKDLTPQQVRGLRQTLSLIYSGAHDYAKAEEQLRVILDADPNDATANNDLGYQWADQGKNLEEAEKLIRLAVELDRKQRLTGTTLDADADRDNAAYVDSLGWVLFRRGRHAEARKELEKAVALPDGADDPVVWDHLGDVCARLGDAAAARRAWQKAVELYETTRERPLDERYNEVKQKLRK